MSRVQFALENFRNIQELIRFIDQKAGAIIIVYGFILATFIEFAKKLLFINPIELTNLQDILLSLFIFVSGLILMIMLLYQLYFVLFKIIRPRLAKNYSENEYSIFYFEHISYMNREKLFNDFKNITEDRMLDEILGQVYEISDIMREKTESLSEAIKYFFFSILLLLIFILLINFAPE